VPARICRSFPWRGGRPKRHWRGRRKARGGPGGDFDMGDLKGPAPLVGMLLIAVILLASQATAGAVQLIA